MTAAAHARERLGLSEAAAARYLRVSVRYLRSLEKNGGASYALASRAAALYQTNIENFLYSTKPKSGGETPKFARSVRRQSGRKSHT